MAMNLAATGLLALLVLVPGGGEGPQSVEPRPVEPRLAELVPAEADPGDPRPADPRPLEPRPTHPLSADPLSTELGPVDPRSLEPRPFPVWGLQGHEMAARAAVETLPDAVPDFFRDAVDELVWLNPEPDRWRDRRLPAMDEMWRYDHYIDLENIPDPAILTESTDRWDFFRKLVEAGVEDPQVAVGFAPFAVLELHQRLTSSFARWRSERDPRIRGYLESRIIQDAGLLGHFVTDLSQPHHSTIHFNGWDEAQVPNPEGYTTDRGFHARFESAFVRSHVRFSHVRSQVTGGARIFEDPRGAVLEYVQATNDQVEPLYRIDRDYGFGPDTPHPVAFDFAVARIAAGAVMLRDLWWSAWVASEGLAGSGGG